MLMYLQMIDTGEEKRKFVVIYETYRRLMLKVAYDVLNDYYWAEDAVHEAFVKVANHMENIGEVESKITKRYLITITKNTAIDLYRKRKKQMEKEISSEEIEEQSEQIYYMESQDCSSVLDILSNLPAKYKDVFLLKYSSNLENKEIAEILGISEGNVRQRIVRGKAIIQEALNKLEGGIS